jgi:nitrite reductase/ring-hydroxylating ferredoxin subunit
MRIFNSTIQTRIIPQITGTLALLLVLVLAVTACGGKAAASPIKAAWITPQISGDSVSFPVSQVDANAIIHFKVPISAGKPLTFMAYEIDGNLYVRANVCPPCRSTGFSLNGDTLVCDTCRTTFQAKNGEGIKGACVDYPKAEVAHELNNGEAVMVADALLTAYQNTMEPGMP